MIKLKDLEFRKYEGRKCVAFTYSIQIDKDTSIDAKFSLMPDKFSQYPGREWNLSLIIPRSNFADSQVYGVNYVLPKEGMNLELIAATGLKYFQNYIKQEIQIKQSIDFILGDIVGGM